MRGGRSCIRSIRSFWGRSHHAPPETQLLFDVISRVRIQQSEDQPAARREYQFHGSSGVSFQSHALSHVGSLYSPICNFSVRSYSSSPGETRYSSQATGELERDTSAADVASSDVLQEGFSSGAAESFSSAIDSASTASAAAVSEVAAAASDSWPLIAGLQYAIEGVHLYTGLPWWLSIAATTVAIRALLLPVMIYQMKAVTQLGIIKPEMERLLQQVKDRNYEPKVVEAYQKEMSSLMKRHKTTPFAPLIGIFIQAPIFISFYFAVQNMAAHVGSFQTGGALWFVDLSAPDPFYVLPVLSSALLLTSVELVGGLDGMDTSQQANAKQAKMMMRGLAVVMVPLTISFPNGVFCYWVTANLVSLIQGLVFKQTSVKKLLGLPLPPSAASPSTTFGSSSSSFSSAAASAAASSYRSSAAAPLLYTSGSSASGSSSASPQAPNHPELPKHQNPPLDSDDRTHPPSQNEQRVKQQPQAAAPRRGEGGKKGRSSRRRR